MFNINSLDDQVLTDAAAGFGGGQQSFGPPDQLQVNQSSELVNVDILDNTATTRRGTETLGAPLVAPALIQGIGWWDTPTAELLFAASNGKMLGYDGNVWAELDATYTAGTTSGQINMAQLVDEMYFVDGISALVQWDGINMNVLGTSGGDPGDLPAKAAFIVSANFRLWAAGFSDAPDTLWASKPGDGTAWSQTYGNIRVGQGDGDPITGICAWDGNRLVVFKRNSIYIVTASPVLDATSANTSLALASVTMVSNTIGCVSNRSIVRVGPEIYFLSDAGVYALGRVIAQDEREVKPALSKPVQDIIERINGSAATTVNAFFWNHRYFIALPLDAETTPSSVLVFNVQQQGWSGLWTGWQPTCWALSKRSGKDRMDFGRADGYVWQWLDYVLETIDSTWQDDGDPVPTSITTRAMIFSDPVGTKNLLTVHSEFFESETLATLAMSLDEQESLTLASQFDTSTGELLLDFLLPAILPNQGLKKKAFGAQHLPQFFKTQAVITSTSGKLSLRSVILNGFGNTIPLEQA